MGRLTILSLMLLLLAPTALAQTPAPSGAPVPARVPHVGTPSPEAALIPTRVPRGWYQVGDVGFNISDMTTEERLDLINALQNANLLASVSALPSIDGTQTTRENPCYMGQRAAFTMAQTLLDRSVQQTKLSLALQEVVRGEAGTALVHQMNALNEPPPTGKEYVVAVFDIGISGENPNHRVTFTTFDFQPVSNKGRALDYAFITDDMGVLELFAGGSGSLRVTALVDQGTDLLLCYRSEVWFSTRSID